MDYLMTWYVLTFRPKTTTKSITTSNRNDDGYEVSKNNSGDHDSIAHGDGNTHMKCVSMCRIYYFII